MNDISTQDISVFKGVTLQDDITARAFLLRYPNVETAIARFFDSQEAGPSNPPASLNTTNPPGPSAKPVSFLPVRNSTMNKDSCVTKTDPSSTQPSDKKMAPKERMSEEEDSEEDDFDFEEESDNSPEESSNMFQKFANTMTDAFKATVNAVKDRINPPVAGPVTDFMEIAGCNEETAKNYINKYGSVVRAMDEYFRKEQGEEEPVREQQQTPNPFTFNFQAPVFQNQVKEKRRRRSWKKRGANNTWASNSTGNNNSSKIKFKLRGGYDEYVKKYLKKDLFESSAQEWPKFLGSLLVECKIDNQDTISKMKRHDQIKFQPEEIEFTSTNITKKNKGEDGIPTRTVVGKNWYIKGTSLLVRCIWKDQFVGYLNCELEEAFVFLLTKKYIFVEAVVVDLPEVSKSGEAPLFSANFGRGFSGYNKIKVQMDVFLTEEVILNPLNVVAIPGRRRGGVKSTRSAKTDEEGESKEEQQAYQMLRLTKESLAKLFNMLKLKVSIPTIVEVRQRIDPFQRIKREKYGVNGRGRRRYYANNFGAQVDVIKNDFSNYYNNKPGNEGNNAKKDNGGMFGGLFKKDLNEEDDDDDEDFDDDFDVDMDSSDGERTGFARFNSYNGFRANSGRFEEEKVNVGNSNKNEGEEANKQNQDLFKNNVSSYYKPADEPETLKSSLHVYQKQALSWMQYREGCIEKEALFEQKLEEQRLLNDLFQEMILLDGSKLYFNPFNGEICAEFPTLKACKGGILADEMGLGKTVMTIALLHAHSRKTGNDKGEFGLSESEEEEEEKEEDSEEEEEEESKKKGRGKRGVQRKSSLKGTLDNFLKKLDKRKKKKKAEDDDEFDLSEEKEEESEEEDEEQSKKKGRGKRGVQRRKSLRGKLDDFLNSKKLDSLKKKTEADDDDFDFSEEKEDDDDEEFEISTTKKIKVDNKKSKTVEKKTKAVSVVNKKGKSSKPTKKKSASKSREAGTLIVLPMTVLNQWESEIKAHSKPGTLSVFQYYGGGRKKTELENYDVVLTTYGVLESEYSEYLNKVPSGLFDCNWFRVILDEAHYIKSRQTKTTKAACAVKAEYRWCLTGTPLQNKLDDMFSLMQFLRVDTWGEYFWWNTYINKYTSHDEAANLIRGILKPIILRRTKKSTYLNGSNILELPGKKVNTCMVKLTHEERAIYNCFFQGSKQQFNELVTSGTIQYEYAHIFELLIRLRQVCNHPSLVFSKDDLKNKDSLESAVFKFLDKRMPTGGPAKEIKLEPAGNKKTIVVVDDDDEGDGEEEKKMETENPMMHSEFIQKTLERLKNKELEPCCICLEEITDPAIAKCGHIFCKTCLTLTVNNLKRCPLCQSVIDLKDIMSISLEDKERCKDLLDMNCATFKKSSKLEAVINESKEVAKRGEKCVVFSQFIGMLNLVERFYKEENIEYRRIDGSCTLKERAKCIEDFNKEKGVTAFLISLKAGAIGLNLTVATNVFLIDPWWNPAVEDQAIERVHRIGQKNNVNVVRFVCEKTIEERIQQLNAQKKDMINKILQFNPQEQKKQNLDNMIYVMRGFDDE